MTEGSDRLDARGGRATGVAPAAWVTRPAAIATVPAVAPATTRPAASTMATRRPSLRTGTSCYRSPGAIPAHRRRPPGSTAGGARLYCQRPPGWSAGAAVGAQDHALPKGPVTAGDGVEPGALQEGDAAHGARRQEVGAPGIDPGESLAPGMVEAHQAALEAGQLAQVGDPLPPREGRGRPLPPPAGAPVGGSQPDEGEEGPGGAHRPDRRPLADGEQVRLQPPHHRRP